MKFKMLLSALTVMAVVPAVAQEPDDAVSALNREHPVLNDSLGTSDLVTPHMADPGGLVEPTAVFARRLAVADPSVFASITSLDWHPGVSRLFSWQGGGIAAFGATESLPGLMGIESGGVNISQRFGRFSFAGEASAVKYGYFRGLQTSYGFGGSLSYEFNDNLSLTIFGQYYTRPNIGQPAMAGYVQMPSWGGYVNYRFHDHWGVKVGAQAYQTVMGGRVEAQPIVMPYYRMGNGAELGVDVGGILYQLIRSNTGRSHRGNPTIGPLLPGPPPVR